MIRNKIKAAGEWIEDTLRRLCGRITPDGRVVVILVMFLGFTSLSLYITISSIYRFGRGDGARMQIEHIENLEMELRQKQSELDSINNNKNDFYYEYEYDRESAE